MTAISTAGWTAEPVARITRRAATKALRAKQLAVAITNESHRVSGNDNVDSIETGDRERTALSTDGKTIASGTSMVIG